MKSVNPLISLTSDITQIPLNDVEKILDHYHQQLRHYLKYPEKPVLKIEEFGRFEVKPNIIKRWLVKLARQLREDRNNEELKELFRYWWNVRQLGLKYYENKKRK